MKFGYIRVSTAQQEKNYSLEHQKGVLISHGIEPGNILSDVSSGAKKSRPGLDDLLSRLREGDEIWVLYLSRLGRSVAQLAGLLEELKERGVTIHAITEGIDTSTPAGRLVFNLMASVAEIERELIQERMQVGRLRAEELGRKGGRPTKYGSDTARRVHSLLADGYTVREVCDRVKISFRTFYRLKAAYVPIFNSSGRVIGVVEAEDSPPAES